jgi:predicted HTH domain antitoxin
MLTEIRLHIDDSIFLSLKEEKEEFAQDMLFHHALWLYRQHKLSLGKAAELAGYTRIEFIQQLQAVREPIFDYDEEMLAEMIESAHHTPRLQRDVTV